MYPNTDTCVTDNVIVIEFYENDHSVSLKCHLNLSIYVYDVSYDFAFASVLHNSYSYLICRKRRRQNSH